MPARSIDAASYDHWKTTNPADAELGPEPEEEREPAFCSWCQREFGNPPKERNIERFKGEVVSLTCDLCLEELAEERHKYQPGPICGRDY